MVYDVDIWYQFKDVNFSKNVSLIFFGKFN